MAYTSKLAGYLSRRETLLRCMDVTGICGGVLIAGGCKDSLCEKNPEAAPRLIKDSSSGA